MVSGRNIIIISSIDWDFNWQGPQEIASRLARTGNRVLFIENTGIRRPGLKDTRRVWNRLKYWRNKITSKGFVEIQPNLFLCSPIVLPAFGSRLQRSINQHLFLPFIKNVAKRLEMHDPVILTFLPSDTANQLIDVLRGGDSKVFYYVASDFKELVSNPEDLAQSEMELVGMCSSVLTICNDLTNRYKSQGAQVYTIPYGVDLSAFQHRDKADAPASITGLFSSIKAEKRPIIGYVGAFHRYMDVKLLAECAKLRKDWFWVFVGPIDESAENLKNLPNVLFTGPQQHKNLAHFIEDFDVCIIPYLNVEYTKTVVPVKLNEYLAAGKHVVSTDIPLVCEFNNSHNIIKITENHTDKFLYAIEESLNQEQTPAIIEKRKSVAALSDWDLHFSSICRVINSSITENGNEQ